MNLYSVGEGKEENGSLWGEVPLQPTEKLKELMEIHDKLRSSKVDTPFRVLQGDTFRFIRQSLWANLEGSFGHCLIDFELCK